MKTKLRETGIRFDVLKIFVQFSYFFRENFDDKFTF